MPKNKETTSKKKVKEAKPEKEVQIIKQKSGCSGVIIFILLIIIVLLGLYICYKEGLLGDFKEKIKTTEKTVKKVEVQKEDEIEVLEVVSNDVKHLFSTLTTGQGEYCGIWNYFSDEKVEASDIPNNLATAIALNALYKNGMAIDRKGTTFTSEQLNTKIKEIFGKNYEYQNDNIDICPTYKFNEETNIYTTGEGVCSGACPTPNKAKIVKAYKKGENIEIYVRVLFTSTGESLPTIYYKDVNKTEPLEIDKTKIIDYNIDDETYSEGSLYKMTFTNEDGNYIFTSSEQVTN